MLWRTRSPETTLRLISLAMFAMIVALLAVTLAASDSTSRPTRRFADQSHPSAVATAAGLLMPRQPTAAARGVRGEGPVLVLTSAGNEFTDDVCKALLATEGIPGCASVDAGAWTTAVPLEPYHEVIAADQVALAPEQIERLSTWVRDGGHVIALRPTDALDRLLGLGPRTAVLPEGYFRIDVSQAPGKGLSSEPMQFHGEADERVLRGARAAAYVTGSISTSSRTGSPALTVNRVGSGTASAFAFDPVRSVLRSRNGDPQLTGRSTVSTDGRPRMSDRFGNGYLDTRTASLPQADQVMHLLTNQVVADTAVPRLWYLPSHPTAARPDAFLPAAVLLTGDDHAIDSETLERFAALESASPPGCRPAEWTCLTATSYAVPGAFSDATARPFVENGFEISPHFADHSQCPGDWSSQGELVGLASKDLATWRKAYPAVSAAQALSTERWHCYGVWNTYAGIPDADRSVGIRADTSGSCWPQAAFNLARCFISGTALPMSFADADGRLTGVDQFSTQVTDENPATSTQAALGQLLSAATGPQQFYGYYTVLAHLDHLPGSDKLAGEVVRLAGQYGLPVVSARQAEQFWTARAQTRTSDLVYGSGSIAFTLKNPAHDLELMIPARSADGALQSVTRDGARVGYRLRTVQGITYAMIAATTAGRYSSVYR